MQRSVLNFGMPSLAGRAAAVDRPRADRRAIEAVIRQFEPRLSAVRVMPEMRGERRRAPPARLRIDAQLWGQPVPQHLVLRTSIDAIRRRLVSESGGELAMDPRLLEYYNRELQFVREMGAEFAQAYPRIAARLGLEGLECADPYVERLLEGFAFLTARVQLKLDARHPDFTQHLLEMVYPHFLCPVPSCAIVEFAPDMKEGSLQTGHPMPRGTSLRTPLGKGERTACEFRTAHDVTLWPHRRSPKRSISPAPARWRRRASRPTDGARGDPPAAEGRAGREAARRCRSIRSTFFIKATPDIAHAHSRADCRGLHRRSTCARTRAPARRVHFRPASEHSPRRARG